MIGKEQIIDSKIHIFYDESKGKITKVEDKWDGKLPDSSFVNVSLGQLISPWWWVQYGEGWLWWGWSFTWDMWWWQVRCLPATDVCWVQYLVDEGLLMMIAIDLPSAKLGFRAEDD